MFRERFSYLIFTEMWTKQLIAFALLLTGSVVSAQPQVPPSIVEGPTRNIIFFAGPIRPKEELKLPCRATGNPAVGYEWRLNGTISIPPTGLDGHLLLNEPTSQNQGVYQCFAQNGLGKAMSNKVFVNASRLAAFEDQQGRVKYADATEGKPLKLTCQRIGNSVPVAPVSNYSWQDGDNRWPLGRNAQIDDNGNLHIAVVTNDMISSRIWKCHIENYIQSVTPSGSDTIIRASSQQPGSDTKPQILFHTNQTGQPYGEVIGLEGRTVVMRCFFSGSSSITLSWKRTDGAILPIDSRVSILNFGVRLEIHDLRRSDEGDYACTGSNNQGSTDFPLKLHIQAVPEFKQMSDRPHDRNVTVGENVMFNCTPYAIPAASIKWYKNGAELNPASPPPRYQFSSDRRSLTIQSVCKANCSSGQSDMAVIQCSAENVHGSIIVNGYINVFEKTVFLTQPSEITPNFPEPVKFSAFARTDPDTRVVYSWQHYDEDVTCDQSWCRMDNKTDKILITSAENGTTLTIYDTKMSDTGRYRCVADNGVNVATVEFVILSPPVVAYVWPYWWIPLIILLVLLILIISIILCCCILRNNRGDEYPVDEKEREADRDPEKELADSGFHDYQRQTRHHSFEEDRQPLTS